MKKKISFLLTGLFTTTLGVGLLLGGNSNQKREVNEVEALPDNNVVYLNADYCSSHIYALVLAYFSDGNGHSTIEHMKKVPDTTAIYRVTVPSDYSYTNVTFTSAISDQYESDLRMETEYLTIPTNNNNCYVIDDYDWDSVTQYICEARGSWSFYDDDIPDQGEGYYLISSKTDWKFDEAPKLGEGTHGDKAELINYSAKQGEQFYVKSYFDDEVTQIGDVYDVGNVDKAVNVFVSQEDALIVDDYVTPPEVEGFYINGTFSGVEKWSYDHTLKMNDVSGSYLAEYRGLDCALGDQIRVRNFSYSRHPYEMWGYVSDSQDVETFGHMTGDNFEFTASGNYDVFVKEEGDRYTFTIYTHSESYTVELTACYFDGKTKVEMELVPSQVAYASSVFEPDVPSVGDKYYVGAFLDEACEYPYTPKVIETNCHLYLKYVNEAYYAFTGDLKSGVYDKEYVIKTGIKMTGVSLPDDKWGAEILLSVKANEKYQFGLFSANGSIWPNAGSDRLPPSVEYDYYGSFNYIFHQKGTFYVLINGNNRLEVYDADGEAFARSASPTIKLDDNNHVVTELDTLKSNWNKQKDEYNGIKDKSKLTSVGFKYTEEPTSIYEEFINKYYLAIYLYGSEELENYIFPSMDPVSPHPYPVPTTPQKDYSAVIIAVSVSAAVIVLSGVAYFVIKKRK